MIVVITYIYRSNSEFVVVRSRLLLLQRQIPIFGDRTGSHEAGGRVQRFAASGIGPQVRGNWQGFANLGYIEKRRYGGAKSGFPSRRTDEAAFLPEKGSRSRLGFVQRWRDWQSELNRNFINDIINYNYE